MLDVFAYLFIHLWVKMMVNPPLARIFYNFLCMIWFSYIGLVLHEENISLLTERYKHLKEMAVTRELKCGTSSLTGELLKFLND